MIKQLLPLLIFMMPPLLPMQTDTVSSKISKIPYKHVDVLAKFPQGDFKAYISNNLKTNHTFEYSITGQIILLMTIGADGGISQVTLLKSLSPKIDPEVVRVINASPKWEPATLNGKKVSMDMVLNIDLAITGFKKPVVPPKLPKAVMTNIATPIYSTVKPAAAKTAVLPPAKKPDPLPVKKAPVPAVKKTSPPLIAKKVIPPVVKKPVPPVVKPAPVIAKKVMPPVVKKTPPPVIAKKVVPPVVKKPAPPVVKPTPVIAKKAAPPVVKPVPVIAKKVDPPVVKKPVSPVVKPAPVIAKKVVPPVVKKTPPPITRPVPVIAKKVEKPAAKKTTVPVAKQPVTASQPVPVKRKKRVVVKQDLFNPDANTASFIGGDKALAAYLGNNIAYPDKAKKAGVEGRVVLSFVVEEDGTVDDVEVISSPSDDLSQEAIRVMLASPKWKPGQQNGISVPVSFIIPIKFSLTGKTTN